MSHKVFFCADANTARRYLRRYSTSEARKCNGRSYCDARVVFDEIAVEPRTTIKAHDDDAPPASDPRWPAACGSCGVAFADDDPRQLFVERLYTRNDTGEIVEWDNAGPGAVRDCWWLSDRPAYTGADGRALEVRLPDGRTWMIDSRCSNCTKPDDATHKCWVRHGRPEDGSLHVDKKGNTCSAGGGSIDTGTFHGWLHHGVLKAC